MRYYEEIVDALIAAGTDHAPGTVYYPTEGGDYGEWIETTSEFKFSTANSGGVTFTLEFNGDVNVATDVPPVGSWIDVTASATPLSGSASSSWVDSTNDYMIVLPRGRYRLRCVYADGSNVTRVIRTKRVIDSDSFAYSGGLVIIALLTQIAAATHLEDSPHVSGDRGMFSLAVRRDTPTSGTSSDGDYASFNVDADGYLYERSKAYDPPTNANRNLPVWSEVDRRTPGDAPVALCAAQALGAAWADAGAELAVMGYTFLAVWIYVDVNDSQNVRIRALAKHTAAGADEYSFPIKATDTSGTPYNVKIEGDYCELNVDADQRILLIYPLYNCVPYIQMRVMAEVAGATPGTVTAYATYGFGGAS